MRCIFPRWTWCKIIPILSTFVPLINTLHNQDLHCWIWRCSLRYTSIQNIPPTVSSCQIGLFKKSHLQSANSLKTHRTIYEATVAKSKQPSDHHAYDMVRFLLNKTIRQKLRQCNCIITILLINTNLKI